jgi:ribonuclease HII
MPDFSLEFEHEGFVVGIDEAGRGPWAGPVVAGAAVLDPDQLSADWLSGLDDSKKLKPARREALFERLSAGPGAVLGVGIAGVDEIDDHNILQATFIAMRRAYDDLSEKLGRAPDFALIDGTHVPPGWPCDAAAIIKGDGKSLSIAAASIVAKVTRDRMMAELDAEFPGYGWANNAGYGTRQHHDALLALGVTPHHRKSYKPIRKILSPEDS